MKNNIITTLKGILDQNKEMNPVATHNGPFHADELVALAIMQAVKGLVFPIRTRDQEILELVLSRGGYIFDVGGEYDPKRGKFDHHFKGAPVRSDGTPYASAGMAAKKFLGTRKCDPLREFVRNVDATDNGIKVEGWNFSLLVHKCNPICEYATPELFDERFGMLLSLISNGIVKPLLEGSQTLEKVLANFEYCIAPYIEQHDLEVEASSSRVRAAFEQGGPVLELPRYEAAMFDVMPEAPLEYLFVVFPNPTGEWMVQQIPEAKGSFAGRKQLPEAWAGKRGAELDAVTGIEGCVFAHPGRFIGGHKTQGGARELALLAAQS